MPRGVASGMPAPLERDRMVSGSVPGQMPCPFDGPGGGPMPVPMQGPPHMQGPPMQGPPMPGPPMPGPPMQGPPMPGPPMPGPPMPGMMEREHMIPGKQDKLSSTLVLSNSSTIVDGDFMNPNLSVPPGPGPGIPMPSGPPMSGGPISGGPPTQAPMHGGPPVSQGHMMGGPPMQMSGPGPMQPGMMQGVPPGPMMGPGGPMPNQDPFYTSPFSNFYRRPTPYVGQPDYRIYELNKRLQQRTEDSDNLWWDNFTTEFFEDDAQLTLTFCLEDGPKRYTIGRTLIPRYFRSIFEGGVTDLHYLLKYPKESFHNTTITLDCDHAFMVTQHGKPMFTNQVITEGRLLLEFTFDDLMRIRSWHFAIRQHRELIPRNVIAMQQDPAMVEQLSKNITRMGLTSCTLNFLRLCVILEPMQELMSRHKAYGLNPRDCLKTTLFQKWQRMVAPPGKETSRPPSKRRKRKGSASNNAGGNVNNRDTPSSGKKRSPGPQGFNLGSTVPGDVMVVGEPTLMGGEFGDEDERLITRLENSQFEPTNNEESNMDKFHNSPALQPNSWGGDKTTPQSSTATTTPTTNTPLTEADIKQE